MTPSTGKASDQIGGTPGVPQVGEGEGKPLVPGGSASEIHPFVPNAGGQVLALLLLLGLTVKSSLLGDSNRPVPPANMLPGEPARQILVSCASFCVVTPRRDAHKK